MSKPNILFFFADDWGRDASVYRDPQRPSPSDVIETPNIDRIAHEGVRFSNAYMPCPQCTPSRASIATGNYFWRCGSASILKGGEWDGIADPGDAIPGIGPQLQAAGYHVATSWKTFQNRWLEGHRIAEGASFKRYSLHCYEVTGSADKARGQDIEAQTRACIRKLLADCPEDQPFYYVYGPINTHRPWVQGSGKALWGLDPDDLEGKLPPFLPDVHDVREDYADYLGEVLALDLMVGVFYDELKRSGRLDDTMIVLTGDNGIPGFPRGKCNLYDLGVRAPLMVRWPGRVAPGRIVDDFVNLMDFMPTWLEAAGAVPQAPVDGRSLMPQLLSEDSGQVDPSRDHAVVGRNRHLDIARDGNLPYCSRAIRSGRYLYIRNFQPDRWPMGDPYQLESVSRERWEEFTDYWRGKAGPFRDMDPSPTKSWLVTHRNEAEGQRFFDIAFGKRPGEELYDIEADPGQLNNLADSAEYAAIRDDYARSLMAVLEDTGDPVLNEGFDHPPYVERKQIP